MARQKKSLQEKIQAEMPEFVGEVSALSSDQLNGRLAKLAKDAEANEQAKEDDEELEEAHTHASELGAPYRDAKKALRLKTRYIISLLKEKGGA